MSIPQSQEFKDAADTVGKLTTDPGSDMKLKLYSFYKQGTIGPNTTVKPGVLDPKGRAKWNAWSERGDMPPEEAQAEYIKIVNELLEE